MNFREYIKQEQWIPLQPLQRFSNAEVDDLNKKVRSKYETPGMEKPIKNKKKIVGDDI